MTTKDIIAAFRSGQLSEEEAVTRLASLHRRKSTSEGPPAPPTPVPIVSPASACDIAVIGMSGRFPDAANVDQFWKNLTSGRDCVREVPRSRWDPDNYYDPDPAAPDKSYSKWAGLLDDIDCFDPLFFNISPLEAEFMDPQQRLFLQEAWHAFEDAGYAPTALSGTKCGVFVGVSSGDYQFLLMEAGKGTDAYVLLGNIIAVLAGRIGYALNLKGPSLAIDTASSSSLVAIHHACQSIRVGESEMALAGGVAVLATPYSHILTSKTGALSRTGKCYTFDQRADGFVPSEAVAAILLKPLHKALKDGDHIYGVIKGSGVNQDGSTNGITAPSAESQKNLQLRVYRECGVDPSTVSYVECHGTATRLGDPIEIAALTETFRTFTPEKQVCALGSSKTDVGHALAACGIVGLIKVLCCLDRKQIPPSLHFNTPNRHIAFSESPFYVNTTLRSWDTPKLPRRAAINSFGISGTNAHAVLEEWIPPAQPETDAALSPEQPIVIPLSARSELQLKEYARTLLEYLGTTSRQREQMSSSNSPDAESRHLRQIACTLQTGRIALGHRLAMVVWSVQELKAELQAFVNAGSPGSKTWVGSASARKGARDLNGAVFDPTKPATLDRLVRMAQSWVLGREVDWDSLYDAKRPRRISLPTYPFARERYWVPLPEAGANQGLLTQPVQPRLESRAAPSVQPLRPLPETSTPADTEGDIDWVGAIATHRGERLLFLYQEERDLRAFSDLLRQCEAALKTTQVFQCSYVQLLEQSSSASVARAGAGSCLALDDSAQVRTFLQSLSRGDSVPDVLLYLPARQSTAETKSRTDALYVEIVRTLLVHAPNRPVAGYCCYEATGHALEFQRDATAAEVGALPFGTANHAYRWVKVPAGTPEFQKVATLLRERLAYPPGKTTELVEYCNGWRRIVSQPLLDPIAPPSLGERHRRDDMAVVEKTWTSKPPPLVSAAASRLKGNVVILVNASSLRFVDSRFLQVVDGKIVLAAGEEVDAPGVRILNWNDLSSGRAAARRLLAEAGEIDGVLDLSDVYTEPRSRDALQYGQIGFYQELIARYRELTILYFTHGLQTFQSRWRTMAGSRRAGFMKMLSAEYNHVQAKCIDVDVDLLTSSSLPLIVAAEAHAALEETEICYRRGERFAPCLQSRRLSEGTDGQPPIIVRPNGSYVISGGTNGIGLEIAAYLAASGAKHLALMGITPLPPQEQWRSALTSGDVAVYVQRKLEKLLQIQATGVNLDLYSGRLTERGRLASFLSAFRSKAGRIDGVVHSAGCAPAISNGRFAFINKTQEDLQRVFEPKVDGLEALHDALAGDAPDFFVAFSSMATMVPRFGKGISDYAAANAFVDDFVAYQIGQGRTYLCSMAWVGWSDVGLHRAEGAAASGEPERRAGAVGLLFNTSQEGIDLFVAGLRDGGPRGHRMPCLLNESAFASARETLLWARPGVSGARDGVRDEQTASVAPEMAIAAEAVFDRVLARLKNADRDAREQILSEVDLDVFSDSQIDVLHAMVFEHTTKSDAAAAAAAQDLSDTAIPLGVPLSDTAIPLAVPLSDTAIPLAVPLSDSVKPSHERGNALREIKTVIDAELRAVLRLDNTTIVEGGSFQQYGLDSISGMQLVSRLEKTLGVDVPPRWLIDYSTIETLSEKVVESRQSVTTSPAV